MKRPAQQEKKFIVLTVIHLSELGFMRLIGFTGINTILDMLILFILQFLFNYSR